MVATTEPRSQLGILDRLAKTRVESVRSHARHASSRRTWREVEEAVGAVKFSYGLSV
ncbi:hypothetical protein [Streptomyces sp. NPDC058382]|uniref:hypothetical protein n=1 Tax=unclassified Streptomyces TaxID=2593676 RepID=UPI0036375D03